VSSAARQPGLDTGERALGRKGPDMKLVDHGLVPRAAGPTCANQPPGIAGITVAVGVSATLSSSSTELACGADSRKRTSPLVNTVAPNGIARARFT
jgi:hypothetical protein